MAQTQSPLLDDVRELIAARERDGIVGLAGQVGPAEWADLVPRLEPREVALLIQWLPDEELPELLAELEPADAAAILRTLSQSVAADLLESMDPDDATDVVEELPPAEAEQILIQMEPAEATEIRELLAYPSDSAGGIMTPAFVAVDPEVRADQAIVALRRVAAEAETMYYAYVIDPEERLIGVLSLRNLVLAPPETPVGELMVRDPLRVRADADRETVARLLRDRNLLALPVVDDSDRLLGIVTVDDVLDVLEEETTEDIEKLGGSEPLDEPYLGISPVRLASKRVRWLVVLFVAEAYTGTVLRHFETELQQVVALTFFIPLLIGTGGNTGTQITTTLTRALALGDVGLGDGFRVLRKEWAVGLMLGVVMALASFIRSWTLHVDPKIGLVVALTAAGIVLWASTVASILPLILKRMRLDPAIVSGPLITTVVDGTGLVLYFEIARRLLGL
ncbi:MAG: magnesium transporter [Thermomicrobiales bacterium]